MTKHSTQKIIILSASGTAHELKDLICNSTKFQFVGFLDDNIINNNVIGLISDWKQFNNSNLFVSALGSYKSMSVRKKLLKQIPLKCFITYIHELAYIYSSANIASSSVIFPNSIISAQVDIGIHSLIYHNSTVAHNSKVGNYSMISNGVNISGNVIIGENSYIGVGSTIIEGITIGNNCIVGAGATVINNVPDNHIYISNKKIIHNKYCD